MSPPRTSLAVARLLGEDVARSQRFIAPALLFVAVLAVLFGGTPGPLPMPWAVSALLLYPIGAWLTHAIAEAEEPTARTVTVAAAGGPGPVVAGVALAGSVGVAVLSVLAVVWGAIASFGSVAPLALIQGLFTHLTCGITGVAVGLVCARPLIRSLGWAALVGLVFVVVTGTQSWLPPVGTAVAAIGSGRGGIAPFGGLVLALLLVVAAVLVVLRVERGGLEPWQDRWDALRARRAPARGGDPDPE